MMRLVIDSVTVDKSRAQGRIWFAILWQTGARTEHVIIRNTANYDDLAHFARIEEMVRTLNAVGKTRMEGGRTYYLRSETEVLQG